MITASDIEARTQLLLPEMTFAGHSSAEPARDTCRCRSGSPLYGAHWALISIDILLKSALEVTKKYKIQLKSGHLSQQQHG